MLIIGVWAVLGSLVGAILTPLARALVLPSNRGHPLLTWPVSALMTAMLFGLLAWRVGIQVDLAGYSTLAAVAVPLAAIDVVERRLPNVLLLPSIPIVIALFTTAAVVQRDSAGIIRALIGMSALFVIFLSIVVASRGDMGAADARLAGLLGLGMAWHSWAALIAGTVLGLVCAAVAGTVLIATRRATLRTPIPLGPALIAGSLAAVLIPLG
jgi:leader peptidase (prepilin peptidase)/N-methyltransferase